MPDYFFLTTYRKMHIWLSGLSSYLSHPGLPFGPEDASDRKDYASDTEASLQIVRDLILICQRLGLEELELKREENPKFKYRRDRDLRPQLRAASGIAERLEGLLELWDFLERFKALNAALARLPSVSREEFQSLGWLLSAELAKFQASATCSALDHRSSDGEFRFLIKRDIVVGIDFPGIQEQLEVILTEFFKILQLIRYIRDEMRQRFRIQKLLVLFGQCYHSYQGFVRLLDESRKYLESYEPEVVEAIFSTTFALKVETRKVFQERLVGVDREGGLTKAYAEMEDALGLIKNSFQECFINLIHLLNPSFDERRLFTDMNQRYQETVQLVEDLRLLYRLAREGEEDDQAWPRIIEAMDIFKKRSMQFLFFKDWEEVEAFDDRLRECEPGDRAHELHLFGIYLNALQGEVGKRAVLSKFRNQPLAAEASTR